MRIEDSVKVYRILIHTKINLLEFSYKTPNCIISTKSEWRCTYHALDFTLNIFQASKLPHPAIVVILFTKSKPLNEIETSLTNLFGTRPDMETAKLLNWVTKFYTPYKNLDLDNLYDDLDECNNLDNIFILKGCESKRPEKIKRYDFNEPIYNSDTEISKPVVVNDDGTNPDLAIDKQRFSALIITPFPKETNLTLEIYSTGVINAAGIPNSHIYDKTLSYVNNTLLPLFVDNAM